MASVHCIFGGDATMVEDKARLKLMTKSNDPGFPSGAVLGIKRVLCPNWSPALDIEQLRIHTGSENYAIE